ncbi:hypothetical protein [Mycolicibacterium fortuitum]|uniref:Transmembrane protein n=1 Tax=Mycolicibacterium fortuitum TaxID=1766 RepID=A0A0N9XRJ0_MYCFO|nr:hypothetical protein [Mycolicibacterium fortuitum]AJR30065.1 hypothetical protein G155_12530 [Mycobacterium sp. VKM Ac-1817D]ALI26418.1 hypothetical protein XA26_25750 [Mycolicibacterium fortuitum]MBP3081597.1 hypothetical protein [Mycolicibacterium fortuitum]MCA4723488.1 hypothetical protein [Mycolicibacterium fortuitum]MDG5773550.1 hypothetical protein [Mycolicibacterium fortuitum]
MSDVAAGQTADGGQVRRLPRGVRIADVTVCVLLFLVQAGLGVLALLSFMAFPMSTDNCAYEACGDEKWIGYAMWTAIASLVPAGLFFCVGFIQLGRHRIAFWWVLIGILAQGGVLAAAWRMAALAGPIN